uniref:Chromo domain-containing protein cec-1-like n=2 Tax=Labrus bergylta TaxID=56723 RepID=A0A3Q3GYH6_9LABR
MHLPQRDHGHVSAPHSKDQNALQLTNIFAMDLRSTHKEAEKPPPRLRLSLTRSMSTDVDQGERGGVYHRYTWGKTKHRASRRTIRPPEKKKEDEDEWSSEEEERDCVTDDRREGSLYAPSVCSSPPMLERQDVELEVMEEEAEHLGGGAKEAWTDREEMSKMQTFECDQPEVSVCVPEEGPEDAVTGDDDTFWGGVEEEVEAECPTLDRNDNTTSITTSMTAEEREEDVTRATPGIEAPPTAAEHAGKVIVTKVTIDSLTVTFKEATVAEGFFKKY